MRDAEQIKTELSGLLDELLRYGNQEGSFKVIGVDMERMKFQVEFDIVIYDPDNYIGFAGY